MNRFTRYLGQKCDECGFCRYARETPATLVGRIMEWHGRWCPAWKAQKQIQKEKTQQGHRELFK